MSSPVDVEESPDVSTIEDYKTTFLFSRGLKASGWPSGDYSDASPEKEVGKSNKFYGSGFECAWNIFDPWYLPKEIEEKFYAISRRTGGLVREFVSELSGDETIDNVYSPMHVAASNGDLETLRTLIETNKYECLRRDKHGGTPLHAAARRGRVEALKVILEACPETVKVVTVPEENCLHTAVLYNQVGAVRFLVDWLGRNRDYAHLINGKDYDGKTPLHLATSRKQIQTLEALLTCNVVDVNATTCGSFTALDILSVLPHPGKVDVEMDTILREAGALRARDLANCDANSYAAHGYKRKWFKMSTIIPFIKMVVFLVATLVTAITYYQAAFTATGATFNGGGTLPKQESIITDLFFLFNSMAFVGSLAVAILIIHKLSACAA